MIVIGKVFLFIYFNFGILNSSSEQFRVMKAGLTGDGVSQVNPRLPFCYSQCHITNERSRTNEQTSSRINFNLQYSDCTMKVFQSTS